jgi:TrmH family RNA methyltransferase
VVTDADALDTIAALQAQGVRVLAATGAGEADLDELDGLAAATAWVLGTEAHGLPAEVLEAADVRVRIPIHGRAESLNLATAAAVCLYSSARAQRRASSRESAAES